MASHRRNRPRRPARRPETIEPKKRLLVACEGRVTEPEYITGFCASQRNPLVAVKILGERGVPRTLVEAAKKARNDARHEAKTHNDDNLSFDEVWCVFDVDDHPGVNDARQMARDNGIHVAISNPCFELWLLLHFRDNPGAQTRQTVQRMLKAFLPTFDKHLTFDDFSERYADAKQRARKMQELADDDAEPIRNPSTGVYLLTTSIEQTGTPRRSSRPKSR